MLRSAGVSASYILFEWCPILRLTYIGGGACDHQKYHFYENEAQRAYNSENEIQYKIQHVK